MMNKVEAMMKVLKILVLSLLSVVAIFVLVIGGYVVYIKYFSYTKATWHYVDELKIEKSEFRSEFEEIHEKVLGKYSLYESKHLNMDSMHNVFAKRIVTEVEDVSDFGLLLKEYFAALRTGHAKVCLDEYGVAHSYSDFVQYIEGRIFISHPNIYLAENGFKDKDEIVAINGIPTNDWIALNERYTSAPTEKYRKLNTALSVFNSVADTMRTYTVLRGDKQQKIRLALKKGDAFSDIADGRKSKLVDYKVFGNNIGYIEITSMTDSATEEFVKAFCKVKNQPFLIVDVRRNSGGSSGIGREICEYLIRKPQPHCLAHKYEMTPQPDAYKGRIFLLTSNHTFSAAESFVIDMKESGNATLVGETTGGETADVGDLVRTIIVDSTVTCRMKRSDVINNANIRPGDVIVGLASFGQATYEDRYNGGMGSNGLTSARHDVFAKYLAEKYPESYDHAVPEELVYSGGYHLDDKVDGAPVSAGQLVLSPTRTYAPVIKRILDELRSEIHGMVHSTGGAQTKVLHFIGDNCCVIKDNMFPVPPLFRIIREQSQTDWKEMYKVFNMGHRMEVYVRPEVAERVIAISRSFNIDAQVVGHIEEGKKSLTIKSEFGVFDYE